MIKKLEVKKMVLCILLTVPMIMGTAAFVYANGFEKPGLPGDEFKSVGKSISGTLTAVLEPILSGTLCDEDNLKATFVFVGSCGKEPFAIKRTVDPSGFDKFNMTKEELVGLPIVADILSSFSHSCFPPWTGQVAFFAITKVKDFNIKLNYDYELDEFGNVINEECLFDDPTQLPFQPYGFIGAEVTVEYFELVEE